jgi:flagellar hook assembly protein FlgD
MGEVAITLKENAESSATKLNAYPNPFNAHISLEVENAVPDAIDVYIYDLRGKIVRRIELGIVNTGIHRIIWDGVDELGRPVSSGTYFAVARMKGGEPCYEDHAYEVASSLRQSLGYAVY